jgi:hypothetical protein
MVPADARGETDRQTDGHDEVNRRFLRLGECAYN